MKKYVLLMVYMIGAINVMAEKSIDVCAEFLDSISVSVDSVQTDSLMEAVDTLVVENAANMVALDDSTAVSSPLTVVERNDIAHINAAKYILDKRYRSFNEQFTKRWDDHLFLELGAGLEQIVSPSPDYAFDPMTTAHFGIGKQFSKCHSLRLSAIGTLGMQKEKDRLLVRMGGRLDHLFSLSSYINGYNPSRLVDVSTVLGVGGFYSRMKDSGTNGVAYEGHVGLQFRFFTGPQGYLNIEPYVGVGQDVLDLSETRNWRKYDFFYGANLNFIYYIHNNLSAQSRERLLRKHRSSNYLSTDSTELQSWRAPWFFDLSCGLSFITAGREGDGYSLGNNMSVSVGKWFSSAIGIRLSATSSTFTWNTVTIPESLSPQTPEYKVEMHSLYYGMRAEAMINPFGFTPNYSWNKPFGGHFLIGGEVGWIIKEQEKRLSCHSEAYMAGMNLWTRLNGGIRFFVEPKFVHNIYKIPYKNVAWNKTFSDNSVEVNLGMTMLLCADRFKQGSVTYDEEKRWFAGLGGGLTLLSTKKHYKGAGCTNWNGVIYGGYRIHGNMGIRVGFEFLSLSDNIISSYTDYNLDFPQSGYIPIRKDGLWNRNFFIGLASVNFLFDMRSLCGANTNNSWRFDLFGGPALYFVFGEKCKMDAKERLQANHQYVMNDEVNSVVRLGFNIGASLSYRVKRNMSVFISPTFYLLGKTDLPSDLTQKVFAKEAVLLETFNAGVQIYF